MKFQDQARHFQRFLRTVPRTSAGTGPRTAILVTPWMLTPVPWYAITLACLYRVRGFQPVLILDDEKPPNPTERLWQIDTIAEVSRESGLEVIALSKLKDAPLDEEDMAEITKLLRINVTAYLRRTGVTDPQAAGFFETALTSHLKRFHTLAAEGPWDHFCIPGGLYGSSGAANFAAKRAGIRVASYDSGQGSVTLGTNGIAGHCHDVAKISDARYADYVAAHHDRAVALAREEFELRRSARDRYSYALAAYREDAAPEACDVLLPMNLFDDAAGLGRSRFFSDGVEWLSETVDFLVHQTKAQIAVREHPAARDLGRPDMICQTLRDRYAGEPRFRLVGCRDPISTYALLESARVVLPFASTVGVEAAVLGKHVVVETDVYYNQLGFVEFAASRDDYFQRILRALEQTQPLNDHARDAAWIVYFYGQLANFVDTEFTPQPANFAHWVRRDFNDLSADPKVEVIVNVLAKGIPSWRLQSERIFSGDYRVPERSTPATREPAWKRLFGSKT